jgi:hypothetical protein
MSIGGCSPYELDSKAGVRSMALHNATLYAMLHSAYNWLALLLLAAALFHAWVRHDKIFANMALGVLDNAKMVLNTNDHDNTIKISIVKKREPMNIALRILLTIKKDLYYSMYAKILLT